MNKDLFYEHINTLMDACEYSEGLKAVKIKEAVPELIKNIIYDLYLHGYPHVYTFLNAQKIAYNAVYTVALKLKINGHISFE